MFSHMSVHPSICLSTPRGVPGEVQLGGGYPSQVQLGVPHLGYPPWVPLAGGYPTWGGTPPRVVLDTPQSVCLLRSRSVLCGYLQVNNTFKLAPGNATTCTPCSDKAVPNAGYTECGMFISLSQ